MKDKEKRESPLNIKSTKAEILILQEYKTGTNKEQYNEAKKEQRTLERKEIKKRKKKERIRKIQ